MHWEWRNCPAAWKEIHTSGFKAKHPTMILEAVADLPAGIWHAYFEVAGSNNDINASGPSPLFNDRAMALVPPSVLPPTATRHNMGYYLVDRIYPNRPVFMKTIKHAIGPKKSYFATRQEAARRDVERSFGALQSMGDGERSSTAVVYSQHRRYHVRVYHFAQHDCRK
ncbi:uncharacterized protein LOC125214828 [Salvia hispanica]|uniref:uncharacterized protein LOC125214828 n=1 Tax=Salvia hispanica TaxID=49212 RepID=UPI002009868B|nr:uncharacterized protein LOC125214828 [Salvia hispanica]